MIAPSVRVFIVEDGGGDGVLLVEEAFDPCSYAESRSSSSVVVSASICSSCAGLLRSGFAAGGAVTLLVVAGPDDDEAPWSLIFPCVFLTVWHTRELFGVGLVVVYALYLVGLLADRLYLSPLAKFPGPKLAALTRWYEAYYEIVPSGQYSFQIDHLHDVYGPIVRVAPNELHIRDSTFYDVVYAKNPKVEKPGWDVRFGSPTSVFTTVDAAVHRRRRAALNPMFSRRSIFALEHLIGQQTELLCKRISEFKGSPQPLDMTHFFPAFTGDIIMEYAFGFSYKQLESPNFESFHEAFMAIGSSGHVAAFFPLILKIMNSLPDTWVEKIQPAMASLLRLKRDQWDLVGRTIRGEDMTAKGRRGENATTIFHEILQSGLPAMDKTQLRVTDEAQIVVAAGVETTAFALSVGSFHIVNTPRIYEKLCAELVVAFPDGDTTIPDLLALEKLPYLRGCIQESLQLSYGLSARNPRRHPDRPLVYKDWVIPAGTMVGMTIVDVHHDETIFLNSHEFRPERWLDDPHAPDGSPLDHYLVAFGRGTRVCLGMNLAWAELFFAMGTIFRRFEFKLFETDVTDVKYKYDFFTPRVKLDSKGVRVMVV